MNKIMSRGPPPNYSAQRLSPTSPPLTRQPQQQLLQQKPEYQQQRLSSVSGSRQSTRRLSSPLDFTDSIPFNELRLSTETLGSGSFGTVFKGRWRSLNVAVKHFKTREEIDSFSIEVKQLSRVRHPNIVKLYGASSPSKTAAYLVMEYAEGGSLNHLLHECRQQEYDLRHACSWAMQTARGVAYLHSLRPKPIMHRDLKPANLLLFSRGQILKICDFGTACAVKTQMTNNTGSASYMAPEVFATSSYLESGDVFSWSIIFWEILVRLQPYYKQYSNPYQILWRVNQGTRPKEIDGCPDVIWNLITRSWDKDPNERPAMKQVAQEMEFIFSLTRTSDSNSKNETVTSRSLMRSPDEATTPTDAINDDAINETSTHTKCKLFVRKLIPSSVQRKPSTPAKPSVSYPSKQPDAGSSPTSPINIGQDEQAKQTILYNQDLTPPQLVVVPQNMHDEQVNRQYQSGQIRHHQGGHYQMSESSSSSIYSHNEPTTAIRLALRRIELLKERYYEIQNELNCDKKNSTAGSFKEFSDLKKNIENLRSIVRKSGGHHSTPSTTTTTTNHKYQRSHNQQIHELEKATPQVIHDGL